MKIKQYQYKLNDCESIILHKGLSYPINDFLSLCYFVNYKDFKINELYLKLIPIKIQDLKGLKNILINLSKAYTFDVSQITETLFYKQSLFKKEFPKEFNTLLKMFNKDDDTPKPIKKYRLTKAQKQYKKILFKKIKKSFTPIETENLRKLYTNYFKPIETETETETEQTENILITTEKFKMFSLHLKDTIKMIEKRIKFYYSEIEHKHLFREYKINPFDLEQLNKGILTDNTKRVYHFYMVKQKRLKISKKAHLYLNSVYSDDNITIILKDIITEYSKYQNISKDFDSLISDDLITFEKNFLNKTI